jgi:hypothetical protein
VWRAMRASLHLKRKNRGDPVLRLYAGVARIGNRDRLRLLQAAYDVAPEPILTVFHPSRRLRAKLYLATAPGHNGIMDPRRDYL